VRSPKITGVRADPVAELCRNMRNRIRQRCRGECESEYPADCEAFHVRRAEARLEDSTPAAQDADKKQHHSDDEKHMNEGADRVDAYNSE